METEKSMAIIQNMINESKKSLVRNSFFFLLWAALLVPAGLIEFLFRGNSMVVMVWPIMGILGGIISTIYSKKESTRIGGGVGSFGDRVTAFTWGAFGFGLIFSIGFSVKLGIPPHGMILLLAGMATFINGGISNFSPFIYGAVALASGALLCAFVIESTYHPIVFSVSIFIGYLVPGIQLRRLENGQIK